MCSRVWCISENDLLLDPSHTMEYFVAVVFETLSQNETVRFEPWGPAPFYPEDFNLTQAQEEGL